MPQVRDVLQVLETIAPSRFALSFDKVGLQVGDPDAQVRKAVVSLDPSRGAVGMAESEGAQMLIAHHPLIFESLRTVTPATPSGRVVLALARAGIAFAAAHTNWDAARGGINDALAEILGLAQVEDFGSSASSGQLKLVVYCPAGATQRVIDAASEAGAGVIGEYRRCAFVSPGTGTFLGSDRSHPVIGIPGNVEAVPEERIEMVLPESAAARVRAAVLGSHPYEEPAFDFFVLASAAEQPLGRLGVLTHHMPLGDLVRLAAEKLGTQAQAWGDPARMVARLAVVGGSADSEWTAARVAGADALLTGEVKQHVGLEASDSGFAVVAAGHYATEQPGCEALCRRLRTELPEIAWELFEPPPGRFGRPFHEQKGSQALPV